MKALSEAKCPPSVDNSGVAKMMRGLLVDSEASRAKLSQKGLFTGVGSTIQHKLFAFCSLQRKSVKGQADQNGKGLPRCIHFGRLRALASPVGRRIRASQGRIRRGCTRGLQLALTSTGTNATLKKPPKRRANFSFLGLAPARTRSWLRREASRKIQCRPILGKGIKSPHLETHGRVGNARGGRSSRGRGAAAGER